MTKRFLKSSFYGVVLISSVSILSQNQLTLYELQTIENLIDTGEVTSALEKLDQEIQEITERNGRYSTELIPPMILKGDAYMKAGEVESAIVSYDDARFISRQHYGLHDLGQVEILYREAEAYYAANEIMEANDRHEYAFSVFTRRYGTDSEQILPGLFRLASWYMDTQNIITARGLYERALSLSEDRTNPELVDYRMDALKNLATTYRLERFRPSTPAKKKEDFKPRPYGSLNHPDQYYAVLNDYAKGEEALLELVRLRLAIEDPQSTELAEAKLELADWYLLFGKREKALVVYKDIWETLIESSQSHFIEANLSQPVPLYQPLPPDPVPEDSDGGDTLRQGRVEFTLSVSDEGKTSNIEEIDVRPSYMSAKIIEKSLEQSIYRPAFSDGQAVGTDEVSFVHHFIYSRDDD